jgi:hypothetical protein
VAGVAAGAQADPITTVDSNSTAATDPSTTVLGFDTSKSFIGTTGVTATNNGASATPTGNELKLTPVAGGTFLSPSFLSLGAFQANTLGAGQSVTYSNTPFHFMFSADSINGQTGITPNDTQNAPLDIGGVLNGTLSGPSQSSVTATFGSFDDKNVFHPYTPADSFKFNTGLYTSTLTLPNNPVALVPSSTNNGMTTTQAFLTSTAVGSPVPEPSTVVLFAAVTAGLGFRHRLRRARAGAR